MPQANDEDQERYRKQFGDIDCNHGISYLVAKGYKPTPDFCWSVPFGHKPTEEEIFIINFLVDEWDFGEIDKWQK